MNVLWSQKELVKLAEVWDVYNPYEIMKALPNRSWSAIRTKAYRLKLPPAGKSVRTPKPQFKDLKIPEPKSAEDLFNALEVFQDASMKLDTRMENVNAFIDTEEPIIVGFIADAHIGALSTKYQLLDEYIEYIANTERFYMFSVGDTTDNYLPTKHGAGMFGSIVPPSLQKSLIEYVFGKLRGRWLGLVQGCHDEWSHESDDFDWTSYLAGHLDAPNLGFGAFVNLTVGQQPYVIALRHKYRYNSSFNLTHTVKRMREQLGEFDIGCVAHHHQADMEHLAMSDKDRVFIRPGSFKGADRFARSIGFTDTGSQIPSVILFPNHRRIVPFLNLEDAITHLRGLEDE